MSRASTFVSLALTASIFSWVLAGCGSADSQGAGGGSPATPANPPAKTSQAQGKFIGLPSHCPSVETVTPHIDTALPYVNEWHSSADELSPNATSKSIMNCTYSVTAGGSETAPSMTIDFNVLKDETSDRAWESGMKQVVTQEMFPDRKFISGVTDVDAVYYQDPPRSPSVLYFFSGGTLCELDTKNFTADKGQLVALAKAILEG